MQWNLDCVKFGAATHFNENFALLVAADCIVQLSMWFYLEMMQLISLGKQRSSDRGEKNSFVSLQQQKRCSTLFEIH